MSGRDFNIGSIKEEIDRDLQSIQAEIYEDLQSLETLTPLAETPPLTETTLEEQTVVIELAESEEHSSRSREDEALFSGSEHMNKTVEEPKAYYSENIKQESIKIESNIHKSTFKQILALVCVGAVLGGGSIGLSFGAGREIAREIIIPKFAGEKIGDIDTGVGAETQFTFNYQTSQSVPANVTTADFGLCADIVNRVEPSVVSISVKPKTQQKFFSLNENPSGSGIIFAENSEKVFIVTNNHVINDASVVNVSISGSESVSAKLVGKEARSDIAVIYVLKEELNEKGITQVYSVVFGNSDEMQVGESVLAIGNALGEGNTATQGIVSAKNKEISVGDTKLTVIQTDAAINPGNSGGPLVNMRGEVIGINTAKLSEYNIEGMGYSITSNITKQIVEDLMNQKPKAFLGIQGMTITNEMAGLYNLPMMGVIIEGIEPDSAAEAAGLQRTDIITSFNGEIVMSMEELSATIKECKIGEEVEIKILRNGKTAMKVTAVLTASSDTNF